VAAQPIILLVGLCCLNYQMMAARATQDKYTYHLRSAPSTLIVYQLQYSSYFCIESELSELNIKNDYLLFITLDSISIADLNEVLDVCL
jgi:hypothetical protein